jgi:hypothetical protein
MVEDYTVMHAYALCPTIMACIKTKQHGCNLVNAEPATDATIVSQQLSNSAFRKYSLRNAFQCISMHRAA